MQIVFLLFPVTYFTERKLHSFFPLTGAQMLYNYLPIAAGLNRIVFYKRHDLHLLKRRHNKDPLVTELSDTTPDQQEASDPSFSSNLRPRGIISGEEGSDQEVIEGNDDGNEVSEAPLISYVLLCECLSLKQSILTSVCAVIDQLRARCCGYSALYVNCSLDPSSSPEVFPLPSLTSRSHDVSDFNHSRHHQHHQLPPSSS